MYTISTPYEYKIRGVKSNGIWRIYLFELIRPRIMLKPLVCMQIAMNQLFIVSRKTNIICIHIYRVFTRTEDKYWKLYRAQKRKFKCALCVAYKFFLVIIFFYKYLIQNMGDLISGRKKSVYFILLYFQLLKESNNFYSFFRVNQLQKLDLSRNEAIGSLMDTVMLDVWYLIFIILQEMK